MSAFKKFLPMFDRVLVQRFAAETKTKGGVLIPEKAQAKVLKAEVIAVGAGLRNEKGDLVPLNVKVGDKILLPEFGGTKVALGDEDYHLFREGDILGRFET